MLYCLNLNNQCACLHIKLSKSKISFIYASELYTFLHLKVAILRSVEVSHTGYNNDKVLTKNLTCLFFCVWIIHIFGLCWFFRRTQLSVHLDALFLWRYVVRYVLHCPVSSSDVRLVGDDTDFGVIFWHRCIHDKCLRRYLWQGFFLFALQFSILCSVFLLYFFFYSDACLRPYCIEIKISIKP